MFSYRLRASSLLSITRLLGSNSRLASGSSAAVAAVAPNLQGRVPPPIEFGALISRVPGWSTPARVIPANTKIHGLPCHAGQQRALAGCGTDSSQSESTRNRSPKPSIVFVAAEVATPQGCRPRPVRPVPPLLSPPARPVGNPAADRGHGRHSCVNTGSKGAITKPVTGGFKPNRSADRRQGIAGWRGSALRDRKPVEQGNRSGFNRRLEFQTPANCRQRASLSSETLMGSSFQGSPAMLPASSVRPPNGERESGGRPELKTSSRTAETE